MIIKPIKFQFLNRSYYKIELKIDLSINMKINLSIQFIYQKKKKEKEKENRMELLSIGNEYISHNLCTKDLDRFMCNKAKKTLLFNLFTMF